MTQETTIAKDEAGNQTADDFASTHATAAGTLSPTAATTENLVSLEQNKRKKTWGEHKFDIATYGGVALLGNEATSLLINKSIEPGNWFHNLYRKFASKFESLERFQNIENGKPILARYIFDKTADKDLGARLPYLLVATIGGMLMVPIVKHFEDRKGEIVRRMDRKHYGARADTDPALIDAHKEMDEAPKQSWSSLGKGRLITVISAAIADYTFGWKDSVTARLAEGTRFERWSSLDAIAKRTAEMAGNHLNMGKKGRSWVQVGTWLLTLSTTLTVLFYASSKLFARRRDEKLERRHIQMHDGSNRDSAELDSAERTPEQLTQEAVTKAKESSKSPEIPQPKVNHVAHEQTVVAATPELATAGV